MYPLAYPTATEWQAKKNVLDQGYAPSLTQNVPSGDDAVNNTLGAKDIKQISIPIIFSGSNKKGVAQYMIKENVRDGNKIYTVELIGIDKDTSLIMEELALRADVPTIRLPSSPNPDNDFILGAKDANGSYMGWFNPEYVDKYISIMENAKPITLIHELGHHFLSVLSPENPASDCKCLRKADCQGRQCNRNQYV